MSHLLPLFLALEGRDVLVVGAGPMGAARARLLAEAGARVLVVAPQVRPEAAAVAARVERRPFMPGDLEGVWLAVAAGPPEVNRAVAAAAEARRVLVNAVDDPANASAYFPGVVRRGGVAVAVSTGGEAPALAGLLREGLEELLPDDLSAWRELAAGLRAAWKAQRVPLSQRRPLLLERLVARYARGDGAAAPAVPADREEGGGR